MSRKIQKKKIEVSSDFIDFEGTGWSIIEIYEFLQ